MSLRVEGLLKTSRAVHELQTFTDMLGFKQESKKDSVTLHADHFTLQLQQQNSDIKISGTCAIEHTSLLRAFVIVFQQHCIDEFSWLVRVHGKARPAGKGVALAKGRNAVHGRGQANPQGVPVLSLNFVPALGKGETLPGALSLVAKQPGNAESINTKLLEH
jgi:hypothetical protein